jgi:transcriptional regulator with XRE-family HTH domain
MEQEGISKAQVRAARALLGLSQSDLAKCAGFSSMTVKRAEGVGLPYPSSDTIAAIRAALEAAGVIFVAGNGEGAGVRLRKP